MNVSTFIQPTAEVVSIASLRVNDVYKRLQKGYGDTYEMRFGIVRDVVNNGQDAAFTALEFSPYGNSVNTEIKTYGSGSDLSLFPATVEEITDQFQMLLDRADKAIVAAATELTKQQQIRDSIDQAFMHAGSLTAASLKEIA